jgi:hypothetical protein
MLPMEGIPIENRINRSTLLDLLTIPLASKMLFIRSPSGRASNI